MTLSTALAVASRNVAAARARGEKLTPKRPPVVWHPFALEKEFYTRLVGMVRALFGDLQKVDYSRLAPHHMDDAADDLARLYDPLKAKWGKQADAALPYVESLAKKVSDRNYLQLQAQVKAVIGVDVLQHEPWLKDELSASTREAVKLIHDLGDKAVNNVERIISTGARGGQSTREIRQAIQDELGVSERRAALIAVDQVGKWNGNLNRLRQLDLGVKSYTWKTCGDARVRPAHKARNGSNFDWDMPPADGHPGMPVRCRCVAQPVLDMFADLLSPSKAPAATKTAQSADEPVLIHFKAPRGAAAELKALQATEVAGMEFADVAAMASDDRLAMESELSAGERAELRHLEREVAKAEQATRAEVAAEAGVSLSAAAAKAAAEKAQAEVAKAQAAIAAAEGRLDSRLDAAPTVAEALGLLEQAKSFLAEAVQAMNAAKSAAAMAVQAAAAGSSIGLSDATAQALSAEAQCAVAAKAAEDAANQVKKSKANEASKLSKAKAKASKLGMGVLPDLEEAEVAPHSSASAGVTLSAAEEAELGKLTEKAQTLEAELAQAETAGQASMATVEPPVGIPVPPIPSGLSPDELKKWKANEASKKSKAKAALAKKMLAEASKVEQAGIAVGKVPTEAAYGQLAIAESRRIAHLAAAKVDLAALQQEELAAAKALAEQQAKAIADKALADLETKHKAEQAALEKAATPVKDFGNNKAVLDSWAKDKYDGSTLSSAEKAAIVAYQQPATYKAINSGLRGVNNLGLNKLGNKGGAVATPAELVAHHSKTIEALDKALASHANTESFRTFRGFHGQAIIDKMKASVGGVYVDKGYVSTSPMQGIVEKYAKSGGTAGKAIMEIVAPPGTPSYYLNAAGPVVAHDAEILLGRDLQYRILSHEVVDGVDRFKVEVVPPGERAAKSVESYLGKAEKPIKAESPSDDAKKAAANLASKKSKLKAKKLAVSSDLTFGEYKQMPATQQEHVKANLSTGDKDLLEAMEKQHQELHGMPIPAIAPPVVAEVHKPVLPKQVVPNTSHSIPEYLALPIPEKAKIIGAMSQEQHAEFSQNLEAHSAAQKAQQLATEVHKPLPPQPEKAANEPSHELLAKLKSIAASDLGEHVPDLEAFYKLEIYQQQAIFAVLPESLKAELSALKPIDLAAELAKHGMTLEQLKALPIYKQMAWVADPALAHLTKELEKELPATSKAFVHKFGPQQLPLADIIKMPTKDKDAYFAAMSPEEKALVKKLKEDYAKATAPAKSQPYYSPGVLSGPPLAEPNSKYTPQANPKHAEVKQLMSPQDLASWAKGKYEEVHQFTAAELKAMASYQGSGYTSINNSLRDPVKNAEARTKNNAKIVNLDKVMNRNKIKEEVLTYRGVRGVAMVDKLKALVGGVFVDDGYMSTSPMPGVAKNFGGSSPGSVAIMEIRLKPGTPSYHFNSLGSKSIFPGEAEILMGRGVKVRVVEHYVKNGIDHFIMETEP